RGRHSRSRRESLPVQRGARSRRRFRLRIPHRRRRHPLPADGAAAPMRRHRRRLRQARPEQHACSEQQGLTMSYRDYVPHSPELQRRFRGKGLWNDDRLTDYVEKWAKETPDKVAMEVPGGPSLTYAQTLKKSRRFANALLAAGFRKGDVIAIQLPSHPEFLIA